MTPERRSGAFALMSVGCIVCVRIDFFSPVSGNVGFAPLLLFGPVVSALLDLSYITVCGKQPTKTCWKGQAEVVYGESNSSAD